MSYVQPDTTCRTCYGLGAQISSLLIDFGFGAPALRVSEVIPCRCTLEDASGHPLPVGVCEHCAGLGECRCESCAADNAHGVCVRCGGDGYQDTRQAVSIQSVMASNVRKLGLPAVRARWSDTQKRLVRKEVSDGTSNSTPAA